MTVEEMWDELTHIGVSDDTLEIITQINSYSEDTMRDVLFAVTGDNTFGGEDLENA